MFKRDPCFTMSSSPHSPHSIIPPLVAPNSSVLDVGCNTGYMAKTMNIKNVTSDGIDINQEALRLAKKYCRKVYRRDLFKGKMELPKFEYDYIIFADVLEHLPRPDLILIDAKKYLSSHGIIIISLPNVARIEIRLQLFFGKFDYTDDYILSEDHLRFFTKESGRKFIEDCGLVVNKIIPTGLGHAIRIFDTLTAVQFIYMCVRRQ